MYLPLCLVVVGGLAWPDRCQGQDAPPVTSDLLWSPGAAFDLDAFLASGGTTHRAILPGLGPVVFMPDSLLYPPLLASPKESRMGTALVHIEGEGWKWDSTLGARMGVLRWAFGPPEALVAAQLDLEASAQVRTDPEEQLDLVSSDFRVGLPLTFSRGVHRWKIAYYHMSAHAGDEFLLKNPGFLRRNWSRDALVLGYARYLTPVLRLYAEAGWAMASDVSKPWEFQWGAEWVPALYAGRIGAPFLAVNGHLREELDFGGTFTAQAGWSWRGPSNGHLLRLGVQYVNGGSTQMQFFDRHEEQLGVGIWFDY